MIKARETVYGKYGEVAEYIQEVDGKHLVRVIYEDYSGEPHFGGYEVWDVVFPEPIGPKIDPEYIKLQEERKALQEEAATLRNEIESLQIQYGELAKTLGNRVPALERIQEVLDGKFEYFLIIPDDSRSGQIVTKDEYLKDKRWDHSERGLKLLSLFGDSKGNLLWRVNRYKDGSGGWIEVIPCFTKEEAEERLKEVFDGLVESWRKLADNEKWRQSSVFSSAKEYPDLLILPDDLKEYQIAQDLKSWQANVKRLELALKEAKEGLAKVTG